MTGVRRLATTDPIGSAWAGWVSSLNVRVTNDPMLVFQIAAGHPVGPWPTDALQRVYLALDAGGRSVYAGQTRGSLSRRMAGHRSTGASATWGWLVFVTITDASAHELDAIEASARQFFLFGPSLLGRKHPQTRVNIHS